MGEVSNAFVVAMGIGVVFVGLICIVVLCMVMSRLCRPVGKKVPAEAPAAAAAGSADAGKVACRKEKSTATPARRQVRYSTFRIKHLYV